MGGVYDPSTLAWRRLPDGPLGPREGYTSVWTGTAALIVGGTSGDGFAQPVAAALDPRTGSWRLLPGLNEFVALRPTGAVWTGDQVLLAGARYLCPEEGSSCADVTPVFIAYDPTTDRVDEIDLVGAPLDQPSGSSLAPVGWFGERAAVDHVRTGRPPGSCSTSPAPDDGTSGPLRHVPPRTTGTNRPPGWGIGLSSPRKRPDPALRRRLRRVDDPRGGTLSAQRSVEKRDRLVGLGPHRLERNRVPRREPDPQRRERDPAAALNLPVRSMVLSATGHSDRDFVCPVATVKGVDSSEIFIIVALAWSLFGVSMALVMGRRGHQPFMWLVLGIAFGPLVLPLAANALRQTTGRGCRAAPHGRPGTGSVDVLAGIDGSDEAENALHAAIGLLGPRLGLLTLAAVVDYDIAAGSGLAENNERARGDLVRTANATALRPETVLLSGRPAEALRKYAVEHGYEVMVVGKSAVAVRAVCFSEAWHRSSPAAARCPC